MATKATKASGADRRRLLRLKKNADVRPAEGDKMLAWMFTHELQLELGPRWSELLATKARDPHAFCDANMTMARAFHRVYGWDPDPSDEGDCGRWGRGWSLAETSWGDPDPGYSPPYGSRS